MNKWYKAKNNNLIPPFYLWIGLFLFACFTLIPFLYLFLSSISQTRDLISGNLLPSHVTWSNFSSLFRNGSGDFIPALKNSVIVGVMTAIFTLVISILASYAFARVSFPFRMTALFIILIMQILPAMSIIVPVYMMMRNGIDLGFFTTPPLLDTPWALIIIYTTISLPFAIWLLTGYFQAIPKELEESSMVDGCNKFQTMVKVILPLAMPGIAATGIFVLLNAWDEFTFASALTETTASKTLPVIIREFIGKNSLDWGPMTAGGFIASLAPVIISLFFYRHIVGGLTAGGVKE